MKFSSARVPRAEVALRVRGKDRESPGPFPAYSRRFPGPPKYRERSGNAKNSLKKNLIVCRPIVDGGVLLVRARLLVCARARRRLLVRLLVVRTRPLLVVVLVVGPLRCLWVRLLQLEWRRRWLVLRWPVVERRRRWWVVRWLVRRRRWDLVRRRLVVRRMGFGSVDKGGRWERRWANGVRFVTVDVTKGRAFCGRRWWEAEDRRRFVGPVTRVRVRRRREVVVDLRSGRRGHRSRCWVGMVGARSRHRRRVRSARSRHRRRVRGVVIGRLVVGNDGGIRGLVVGNGGGLGVCRLVVRREVQWEVVGHVLGLAGPPFALARAVDRASKDDLAGAVAEVSIGRVHVGWRSSANVGRT